MKRVLIVLIVFIFTCPAFGGNRNRIDWWLYYYGDYSETDGKSDPRVPGAFAVFERVKQVADKVVSRIPRLFIIDTGAEPYALALPDGAIVINRKTLEICYSGVDEQEAHQRLAYILGHELAHLSNNDFLHREVFQVLREFGGQAVNDEVAPLFDLSSPEKTGEFKKKEFMADKMGALYASMAGYDIGGLLGKTDSFLAMWARQTGIGTIYDEDTAHPSFEKRVEFVRSQLMNVVQQMELFNAGVLLYQMENYGDAAAAFFEFSKVYPSGEVFNNIGACHFNLALKRLHFVNDKVYYRFRISTTIRHATHAESLLRKKPEERYLKDILFSRYIDRAEEYLRLAVERDSQDKTSRCNLAAVLILKGEYARAQAECDHILNSHPEDAAALNNKAIAFYYYGKKVGMDFTQKSIRLFHEANRKFPHNVDILYNLASLKGQRERLAGARLYWEKYLNISPKDGYYTHIYKKLNKIPPPAVGKTFTGVPAPPKGVGIGEDILKIENEWTKKKADVRRYRLGINGNEDREDNDGWSLDMRVITRGNLRVVGLDEAVEMVECEIKPGKDIKALIVRFGEPGKIVSHTCGNFYIYKDRGFSFKEVNGNVQAYIWFGKGFLR